MMSCCQPHTARSACVASLNPMPHRPLSSTASASSCQSVCASPNTNCRPSPPALECQLPDQKRSADFSAKPLIRLKPTLDSAQVGLDCPTDENRIVFVFVSAIRNFVLNRPPSRGQAAGWCCS